MELTEQQRERIRQNKERAKELRKRKLEEEEEKVTLMESEGRISCIRGNAELEQSETKEKDEELEPFEEGASELMTKAEATKIYCLPAGTLEICEVIEKPNPRNGSWCTMKLYRRTEIRRRARKRFGGVEGLIAERIKREGKRLETDMEKTKNLFR